MSGKKIEPELIDLNLVVKLNAPFPTENLEDSLVRRGYQVEIAGGNLSGRHNETVYHYDSNRELLAIQINDLDVLAASVGELQEVVDDINITSDHIHSLNLTVKERVWSGSDTTEVFASLSPELELSDKFTHEPKPAAICLLSHSPIPNQSDYFNLRVESYVKNTNYYYVELVYRQPNFEQMLPMFNNLQSEINAIISKIEEEAH